MKEIVLNDDCLTIDEIEDNIIKARAIILNDKQEILLAKIHEFYLFPGGKVEDGENVLEGLSREVREETGIDIDINCVEPFLFVEHLIKDYPRRGSDVEKSNRRNATYYYILLTNEDVNKDKMQLMENEKAHNFHTFRIHLEEIKPLIESTTFVNPRSEHFSKELLTVVQELKEYLEVKDN